MADQVSDDQDKGIYFQLLQQRIVGWLGRPITTKQKAVVDQSANHGITLWLSAILGGIYWWLQFGWLVVQTTTQTVIFTLSHWLLTLVWSMGRWRLFPHYNTTCINGHSIHYTISNMITSQWVSNSISKAFI